MIYGVFKNIFIGKSNLIDPDQLICFFNSEGNTLK